jgi:hypothetical protein
VKNAEELQAKYLEAAEWFRKAMLEVDRKKIVEQLMKEG